MSAPGPFHLERVKDVVVVIVVTGGMGAGKSTVSAWFAGRGAAVLDLDEAAKSLLDDAPVRDGIVAAFGPDVLGEDGRVERSALARAAFVDEAATHRLNAIVHPRVIEVTRAWLDERSSEGSRVAVVQVPLLVEAPELRTLADVVLAVEAPVEARVRRLEARGVDPSEARRRMTRQASDDQRRAIAHVVLPNDGDIGALEARLDGFWRREVEPRVAR